MMPKGSDVDERKMLSHLLCLYRVYFYTNISLNCLFISSSDSVLNEQCLLLFCRISRRALQVYSSFMRNSSNTRRLSTFFLSVLRSLFQFCEIRSITMKFKDNDSTQFQNVFLLCLIFSLYSFQLKSTRKCFKHKPHNSTQFIAQLLMVVEVPR